MPRWFITSPTAIGIWSFCQEVEKKFSWHCLPAMGDAPALALIINLPEPSADLREAISTWDQM